MGSIVLAGVSSSVGKTTVAVGLIDAFRRRGLIVQPFKVGPDYIDPSHHTAIAGRPSRNLDSWMVPGPGLLELYHRALAGADVAVVEGVMGLFDGYSGGDEAGSTAQVAKLLGAPVILVLDASHTARSAAATALGFHHFDPQLPLSGIILNSIGSSGHLRTIAEAMEKSVGLPILGYLARSAELALPQRHLGLVPTTEAPPQPQFLPRLAEQVAANFDLEAIYRLAQSHHPPSCPTPTLFPRETPSTQAAIAVAQDEAFCFYYQDNLDLLAAWGAQLIPFSPLRDNSLPTPIGGIYLGGGFPEHFAPQLAANQSLMADIRAAAHQGRPIYAECGGLMYLSQSIVDFQGQRHPMVGLVPGDTAMARGQLSLGYAEVEARVANPLMQPGQRARGHEFHYSQWQANLPPSQAAYGVLNRGNLPAGFVHGNLLASYIHLHFGSNPRLAPQFVDSCAG